MSQFEDLAMEATTVGNQSRPTRLAASGLSPSSHRRGAKSRGKCLLAGPKAHHRIVTTGLPAEGPAIKMRRIG